MIYALALLVLLAAMAVHTIAGRVVPTASNLLLALAGGEAGLVILGSFTASPIAAWLRTGVAIACLGLLVGIIGYLAVTRSTAPTE